MFDKLTPYSMSRWFKFAGVLLIVLGVYNFFGSSVFGNDFTLASDGYINSFMGIMCLIASFLLDQKNKLVFIPIVTYLTASMIYSYWLGRGINFMTLIIGSGILYIIWQFKNKGEIS